ncbi:MAG: PQQ-binding-like beta-propeller repeat protein [Verrucomicrobia bacterium]|nr:PQQ-binding-like beta-propeller repeat protein [Verrucomicrobiota bacterium]
MLRIVFLKGPRACFENAFWAEQTTGLWRQATSLPLHSAAGCCRKWAGSPFHSFSKHAPRELERNEARSAPARPLWPTFLIQCSVLAASIASLQASDWPQWRGPNRDAVSTETGLLKAWPSGGPPLAWKTKGLGSGYSGVSVANGKVFTMGDGPDSSFVRALDEKTGKILWSSPFGRPGAPGGYAGPRATSTVDGELVFGLGQFGDLVCLEAATGKEKWRKSFTKDFQGDLMSDWGYSESPLVDGDNLVGTPGGSKGTVIALNNTTGAMVWRSAGLTDAAAYASLLPVQLGGRRQYVVLTDASVAGIAAENGDVLWRAARRGATAVVATPIVHDGSAFVTSDYGVGCNLFKITAAAGGFKAAQVYANRNMANHHGGVVRIGDYLYGYSGSRGWICQDFKSGEVVWTDKRLGKGSLAYADGHLYLRSESGRGTVALVEATSAGYKEKSRFDQPDRSSQNSWPHPVIANGKLYLRDQDVLLCYDVNAK